MYFQLVSPMVVSRLRGGKRSYAAPVATNQSSICSLKRLRAIFTFANSLFNWDEFAKNCVPNGRALYRRRIELRVRSNGIHRGSQKPLRGG